MELPTDDADVPADLRMDAADHAMREAARERQEQFIEYLVEEAGETAEFTDTDGFAIIEGVLRLLANNGYDVRSSDPQVSVFAHPEFVESLHMGHTVYTPEPKDEPQDAQIQIRGADVYPDGMLEPGQLIAMHHDAITIPSPSAGWRPYLVELPAGVVAATVEVDE